MVSYGEGGGRRRQSRRDGTTPAPCSRRRSIAGSKTDRGSHPMAIQRASAGRRDDDTSSSDVETVPGRDRAVAPCGKPGRDHRRIIADAMEKVVIRRSPSRCQGHGDPRRPSKASGRPAICRRFRDLSRTVEVARESRDSDPESGSGDERSSAGPRTGRARRPPLLSLRRTSRARRWPRLGNKLRVTSRGRGEGAGLRDRRKDMLRTSPC